MSRVVHWNAGTYQWRTHPSRNSCGRLHLTGCAQRFEENSTLQGLLGDLILPSVKRKELVMREKALASLGLCCLIDKVNKLLYLSLVIPLTYLPQNMALSSFQLYVGQVQTAPQELKLSVLRIVFDLLMMYDEEFFGRSDEIVGHFTRTVTAGHGCLTDIRISG